MAEVERDLWKSSSSTPLLKQVHLEQIAQGYVDVSFEQVCRRFHKHSSSLCNPQSKEAFPHIQVEFDLLQFVPIAICPDAGHYCKEFGSIPLTPPCVHW